MTETSSKPAPTPRKPRRHRAKPANLRCFIGLAFPLSEKLQVLQDDLQALGAEAGHLRLAPASNLHVTLKFLGTMPEKRLNEVIAIAGPICASSPALQLRCRGIGQFKNSLWVGIDENPRLLELADALNRAGEMLGVAKDDKPYRPHVTVARFRKSADLNLAALLEKYHDRDWGEFAADRAYLYKSETLQEGARYSVLRRFDLKPQEQN